MDDLKKTSLELLRSDGSDVCQAEFDKLWAELYTKYEGTSGLMREIAKFLVDLMMSDENESDENESSDENEENDEEEPPTKCRRI